MYPYPPSLPTEEIRLVVSRLRGDTGVSPKTVTHCCLVTADYGVSLLPDTPQPMGAVEDPESGAPRRGPLTRSEAADHLEAAIAPRGEGMGAVVIPWGLILPVVADLARELAKELLDRWFPRQ